MAVGQLEQLTKKAGGQLVIVVPLALHLLLLSASVGPVQGGDCLSKKYSTLHQRVGHILLGLRQAQPCSATLGGITLLTLTTPAAVDSDSVIAGSRVCLMAAAWRPRTRKGSNSVKCLMSLCDQEATWSRLGGLGQSAYSSMAARR